MSLRSLPLQRTLKKANITNPDCLPVSATTTAIGTRGVMPKEVSFSADPAHGRPAASRRPESVEELDACFRVIQSFAAIRSRSGHKHCALTVCKYWSPLAAPGNGAAFLL